MNDKNRNVIIVGGIILVVLVGGFLLLGRTKSKPSSGTSENVLPKTEALPTVDSSVIVDLKADKAKKEVTLSVDGIPSGTQTIEYELSYNAEGDIPKGVIGTIPVDGEKSVTRKITLGTCSSGTCVYDKGVTSIKVSLKFQTASGAQLFEKEFAL